MRVCFTRNSTQIVIKERYMLRKKEGTVQTNKVITDNKLLPSQ